MVNSSTHRLSGRIVCSLSLLLIIAKPNIISVYSQELEEGNETRQLLEQSTTYTDRNLGITVMHPSGLEISNPDETTLAFTSVDELNEITITTSGKLNSPCEVLPSYIKYLADGLTNFGFTFSSAEPRFSGGHQSLQTIFYIGNMLSQVSNFEVLNDEIYSLTYSGIDREKYAPYYEVILSSFEDLNENLSQEQCDYSTIANELISQGLVD